MFLYYQNNRKLYVIFMRLDDYMDHLGGQQVRKRMEWEAREMVNEVIVVMYKSKYKILKSFY